MSFITSIRKQLISRWHNENVILKCDIFRWSHKLNYSRVFSKEIKEENKSKCQKSGLLPKEQAEDD